MLTVYCDGGSRGNPGSSASAFVVYKDKTLIFKDAKYLGVNTNNFAEYQALVMALTYLKENWEKLSEESPVNLVMDSELVVKQMKGLYKVKNENLKKYFLLARETEKSIPAKIIYNWKVRSSNSEADELVNRKLDEHEI
jgi:ribonuclease HI